MDSLVMKTVDGYESIIPAIRDIDCDLEDFLSYTSKLCKNCTISNFEMCFHNLSV